MRILRAYTSKHMSMRILQCVVAILLVAPCVVNAQQVCLAATTTATSSINGFLQSARNRPWLVLHGIAATGVGDLTQFTDAADSTHCRTLSSMLVRHPAYFFHAGPFTVSTTAAPLKVDSTTGYIHIGETPVVLVFDSTDKVVYYPGLSADDAPSSSLGHASWTLTASNSSGLGSAIDGDASSRWTSGAAVGVGSTFFRSRCPPRARSARYRSMTLNSLATCLPQETYFSQRTEAVLTIFRGTRDAH